MSPASTDRRPRSGAHLTQALARALVLLAPALGLGLGSCKAKRTMHIRSEPPGAEVRVNDRYLGETQLDSEFIYYGTHHVSLTKDGYRTWSGTVQVKSPWYAVFPLDLVSEVLLPFGWHHDPSLDVALVPGVSGPGRPDLRSVLERADVLRRAGPDGPESLPAIREQASMEDDETLGERSWLQRNALDFQVPDSFDPRTWMPTSSGSDASAKAPGTLPKPQSGVLVPPSPDRP